MTVAGRALRGCVRPARTFTASQAAARIGGGGGAPNPGRVTSAWAFLAVSRSNLQTTLATPAVKMEFDMPVDNDDDYSQLPKPSPAAAAAAEKKKKAAPASDQGAGIVSAPEEFSNDIFDGPADDDDDEPVGHRVPKPGEVIWNDKIFSEEEMHK
eukprot:COSAG05_NODE_266_length_12619_cov_81.601677_4_plen_155_part_00